MDIETNLSLRFPVQLPIRTRVVDDLPILLAGGLPITPINLVLEQRKREKGATRVSLDTYVRAARLYLEFCAYRQQSLIGVSNEEFIWFTQALLGHPFLAASGSMISLSGKRDKRTADLMLRLLYSLAKDIEKRYDTTFDWYRYEGISQYSYVATLSSGTMVNMKAPRTHRIPWTPKKVLGLPDKQFVHLLRACYARWGHVVPDGDLSWASEPQAQRGALFFRNLALLLVLRSAGSRRSEAVQVCLDDVDRMASLLYLPTKGHRVEDGGENLPVLLYPWVGDAIWTYVTRYRPLVQRTPSRPDARPLDHTFLFASHSTRNYGQPISGESVRALVSTLATALDPPWNMNLTPHMLRHSFGYELQKHAGTAAVVTGMRHVSSRSSDPYLAGPEVWATDLLSKGNARIQRLLEQAGVLEMFA